MASLVAAGAPACPGPPAHDHSGAPPGRLLGNRWPPRARRKRVRLLPWVRLLAGAVLMAVATAAALAVEVPETRRDALLHLLRHDCGSCHGMTLGGGLGPPLTPQALAGKAALALEATILFGRPGTPMPPWRGMLNEAEVRWLVEVLKTGVAP